jgi:citrate lyase beta subunit
MTKQVAQGSGECAPLDLDAIEARANAATPGPWTTRDIDAGQGHPPTVITLKGFFTIAPIQSWDQRPENAAHIAGMDPTTTLALVTEVRRLRAAVETQRALMKAVDAWALNPDRADLLLATKAAGEAVRALGVDP